MLVEINLIPKSRKKIKAIQIMSILMTVIFAIGIIGIIFLHNQANNQRIVLKNDIKQITAERTNLEQEVGEIPKTNKVSEQMISKLMEDKISTVNLLKPYVQQLPKNGSILTWESDHSGSVTIQIQLASFEQIATYISNLTSKEWVEKANLLKVSSNGDYSEYVITLEVAFSKSIIKKQAGV